jgi:hypothetical protein
MYPVDDADADADGCAVDSSANARTGAADRVVYAATGHTGIGGGANLGAGTDDRACERDCDQRADCHLHRAGGHGADGHVPDGALLRAEGSRHRALRQSVGRATD